MGNSKNTFLLKSQRIRESLVCSSALTSGADRPARPDHRGQRHIHTHERFPSATRRQRPLHHNCQRKQSWRINPPVIRPYAAPPRLHPCAAEGGGCRCSAEVCMCNPLNGAVINSSSEPTLPSVPEESHFLQILWFC